MPRPNHLLVHADAAQQQPNRVQVAAEDEGRRGRTDPSHEEPAEYAAEKEPIAFGAGEVDFTRAGGPGQPSE